MMDFKSRYVRLLVCKVIIAVIPAIFIVNIAIAVGFSPNIQVNPDKEGNINLWGRNTIGVHGEIVHVLWTDFNMQAIPPHSHTYVSRSTDGGITFNYGVRVDANSDQFFSDMTVDDAGKIYVVWTDAMVEQSLFNGISFAKSTDGAETFSNPVIISANGRSPAVAVNGDNVYIVFFRQENDVFKILFSRSTNGGNTFEEPYDIADAPIPYLEKERPIDIILDCDGNIYCVWNDGRREGVGSDIYLAKSTDNGVTFRENVPVSDVTVINNRSQFGSVIAAYGTNVYVTWLEENANEETRILLAKSKDGGESFGEERVFYAEGNKIPAITANDEDKVYIAYSGTRFSPVFNQNMAGLYCDLSVDGGINFTATECITDIDLYPGNPSIYVDENNIIYAVWIDDRTGKNNVYFSKGTFRTDILDTVVTPTFNPDGGTHTGSSVNITITCATEGATIRYTTNGNDPTEASPAVASGSSVSVPLPGTLKAKAWKDGMNPSITKTAWYSKKQESDFTGDGKTQPTLYHEESGTWYIQAQDGSTSALQFGAPGYSPVPSDYDGDGKADIAVYHEASGNWYMMLSGSDYAVASLSFGAPGYLPVIGDFDGDGKADIAVYHEESGMWYIMLSASGYSVASVPFGALGYTPVIGDFDGDGKTDIAVYHELSGWWFIMLSVSGYSVASVQFGAPGYTPVIGDFDGDGKTDIAVYHEASGWWYILLSASGYTMTAFQFGAPGYTPVLGDFDGDGKTDIAVYHEESGMWYFMLSGSGYAVGSLQFGGPGYVPVQ